MDTYLLKKLIGDIVGQTCTGATNPHGSVLSLDFGPKAVHPGWPSDARPHGWRHLTILSPWRLENDSEVICDWNVSGSGPNGHGEIQSEIQALINTSVTGAETEPPGWDLRITFQNGLRLIVFGDAVIDRDKPWFILGTDGARGAAQQQWRRGPDASQPSA